MLKHLGSVSKEMSLYMSSSQLRNADAFHPKQRNDLLNKCRNTCSRHENQTVSAALRTHEHRLDRWLACYT